MTFKSKKVWFILVGFLAIFVLLSSTLPLFTAIHEDNFMIGGVYPCGVGSEMEMCYEDMNEPYKEKITFIQYLFDNSYIK